MDPIPNTEFLEELKSYIINDDKSEVWNITRYKAQSGDIPDSSLLSSFIMCDFNSSKNSVFE